MDLDNSRFRQILDDLRSENPLACRALLGLARIEFTDRIPSLAVTLSDPPRLRVNLDFLRTHARSEDDVQAVLLHEFLHVLLRHTQQLRVMTPLINVALDAVINATLHRLVGPRISGFFAHFYRDAPGVACLLRPWRDDEVIPDAIKVLWRGLYAGAIGAQDAYRTLQDLVGPDLLALLADGVRFIGNHDETDSGFRGSWDQLPPELVRALRHTLESLPNLGGRGRSQQTIDIKAAPLAGVHPWTTQLRRVFLQTRAPDPRGTRRGASTGDYRLPVLHGGDRRAVLRSLWSPIPPDSNWRGSDSRQRGNVSLYLDVSGSMDHHLAPLLSLLLPWERDLRRPLWAFSTTVERAEFHQGRLRTRTTLGTSLDSVLEHFVSGSVPWALIVTDGLIGSVSASWEGRIPSNRLHALITPGGSPESLSRLGIPCTLLPG